MILARFDLSSLYFRSSPAPEPPLSVVAILIVCVPLALRMLPREDNTEESGRDEDATDEAEASDGIRPVSTIVGRRERPPLA